MNAKCFSQCYQKCYHDIKIFLRCQLNTKINCYSDTIKGLKQILNCKSVIKIYMLYLFTRFFSFLPCHVSLLYFTEFLTYSDDDPSICTSEVFSEESEFCAASHRSRNREKLEWTKYILYVCCIDFVLFCLCIFLWT